MEFRYGTINQIGDKDKEEECGRYRVFLKDENIVTGWLHLSKESVTGNISDRTLDKETPVWCLLVDDFRSGVIGGCISTKAYPQKETDKDITQTFFSDDSYISYDRKNHAYKIYIKGSGNKIEIISDGGDVSVECKNATIKADDTCKIDGKLTVTQDATFQGKISATGEIKSDTEVKAGIIALTTHKHNYTDTPVGPATTLTPIP